MSGPTRMPFPVEVAGRHLRTTFAGDGGFLVAECHDPNGGSQNAIAERLGLAWNAHDELVAALHDIEHIFDGQEDCDDGVPNDAMKAMVIIHAALAKAGAA